VEAMAKKQKLQKGALRPGDLKFPEFPLYAYYWSYFQIVLQRHTLGPKPSKKLITKIVLLLVLVIWRLKNMSLAKGPF